jgi:hypothetical protein
MPGFKEIFTLDRPCLLRVHTSPGEYVEVLHPNYAKAALMGCEALKNGARSVEIIPQ